MNFATLLQALPKLITLFTAIQNDAPLWAAIQDLIKLFPQTPATGGGNPPQMMAAIPNDRMAALKSAFDNATGVHAVMRHDDSGEHKAAALDIAGLFSLFTQLLPFLIQIFGKKPATT